MTSTNKRRCFHCDLHEYILIFLKENADYPIVEILQDLQKVTEEIIEVGVKMGKVRIVEASQVHTTPEGKPN